MMRTYTELVSLQEYEERFRYLQLQGAVGVETFGYERYLNQRFYRTPEWKRVRNYVINRDNGCDLGIEGYEIRERILIHHMNPITPRDILDRTDLLLNPDYLICVTHNTHNAIHYGNEDLLIKAPIERSKYDTCPWKRL